MNHVIKTFFVLIIQTSIAQTTVTGKVINASTKEPIGYANIGIVNAGIGTLSNADGSFFVIVPAKYSGDSITFSALGFDKKTVHLPSLGSDAEGLMVLLSEKAIDLDVVEIRHHKQKNKIYEVGNRDVKGGVLETDTLYAGGSVSLLIDNRHETEMEFPIYLQKASLRILKNNLATLKFRVRINAVDPSTGMPGKDLLHQSIVRESDMRKGWLNFDFSNLDFVVHGPFFVTFEQILDVHDRTKIADGYREFMEKHPERLEIDTVVFEGQKHARKMIKRGGIDLPGTFLAISTAQAEHFTCYERDTSLGAWTKVYGIVTAYVTLSDQKLLKKKYAGE